MKPARMRWWFTLSLPVLIGTTTRMAAQDASTPPLPPPGRLIDLGGWRLHLNCTGERNASRPAVVLEAGAGDFSVDWSLVQPVVARFTRVCSYDRAGSGWSELGPRPRTMHQIVSELHALLERAGERPPFVLVGHSYGGALVRLYQLLHPGDVSGMVLVESMADDPRRMSPDGKLVHSSDLATGAAIPAVKMSDPLRERDIPPRIVAMITAQLRDFLPHVNDPPRDKLPAEAQRMRTWSVAQLKHSISNDNPVEAEELGVLRAANARAPHPLGELPLVVLARGIAEDGAAGEHDHRREQAELAELSRSGRLIVATHSGHHIPIDEPQLVADAIRGVIASNDAPRTRNH